MWDGLPLNNCDPVDKAYTPDCCTPKLFSNSEGKKDKFYKGPKTFLVYNTKHSKLQ